MFLIKLYRVYWSTFLPNSSQERKNYLDQTETGSSEKKTFLHLSLRGFRTSDHQTGFNYCQPLHRDLT